MSELPKGIGNDQEVDQANRWMGEQPWYRSLLASWGQTPQRTHLNDQQRQQLIATARTQGIGISGDFEMDASGNISRKGHKLRNALIIGGAAAAALTGGAALGLFGAAGTAGAGGAAATGAAAGAGGMGAGAAGLTAGGAALTGGGAAAATGGGVASTLGTWLGRAGQIGEVASSIGSGRAAGRQAEAGAQNEQDRTRLLAAQQMESALQGRAGIDLQQKQFQLEAPGQRATNSVRGDILANVQDAGISGPIRNTHGQVPQITGGLRPSLMSDNTRQLGQGMSRDALLQQMTGADKFDPMPAPSFPGVTPLPEAGWLDKVLGGIGLGGGLIGGLQDPASMRSRYGVPPIPGKKIPPIPDLGPVDPNQFGGY